MTGRRLGDAGDGDLGRTGRRPKRVAKRPAGTGTRFDASAVRRKITWTGMANRPKGGGRKT